eukprot:2309767-Pyramimonas_sp.AAC.1
MARLTNRPSQQPATLASRAQATAAAWWRRRTPEVSAQFASASDRKYATLNARYLPRHARDNNKTGN